MVERGGLENRCTLGYPGFESLSLRHYQNQIYLSDDIALITQHLRDLLQFAIDILAITAPAIFQACSSRTPTDPIV